VPSAVYRAWFPFWIGRRWDRPSRITCATCSFNLYSSSGYRTLLVSGRQRALRSMLLFARYGADVSRFCCAPPPHPTSSLSHSRGCLVALPTTRMPLLNAPFIAIIWTRRCRAALRCSAASYMTSMRLRLCTVCAPLYCSLYLRSLRYPSRHAAFKHQDKRDIWAALGFFHCLLYLFSATREHLSDVSAWLAKPLAPRLFLPVQRADAACLLFRVSAIGLTGWLLPLPGHCPFLPLCGSSFYTNFSGVCARFV